MTGLAKGDPEPGSNTIEDPDVEAEEEDLICDAVEQTEEKDLTSFKGCLRSCCPIVATAIQDLRKVKVAEVRKVSSSRLAGMMSAAAGGTSADGSGNTSGRGISGSSTGNGANNNDPEIDHVIERCLDEEIQKANLDTYKYRYLELRNGLKVMLASDPNSKSSAAALDIKIGSFHDPVHLQGLAHLCEHVLFTGSELFPNESYSAFLGQRGGTSNAYTTSEHTNFHFDVPSEHFHDALKRFVSFFQCPILRESSIQNELEIIQSEHEKNRWNDVWRTNQVERTTANPFHVFSHFSTGTRQTLTVEKGAERSLRYELFQFYRCHYSANIMCLCLLHNSSLDELEELAKSYCLGLPNKNLPLRIWPNRPFRPKQMRTKIFLVPVKEVCHVNLTFPMEDLSSFWAEAPAAQVAQLIGHKGEGGLYALLRRKGWAHQLVACHKTLGKGFSLFMVSIQLTEMGEKFADETILHVFQYILLLKNTGALQWFYEELKHLSEQQFHQKDKERPINFASVLALWMHMYPPKNVLAGDYLINNWRPDLVERVMAYLSPDNVRVTVLTKNAKFFASHVEPHYGTEYHVEKIDATVLNSWHNCGLNGDLRVPRPNDLIDKGPPKMATNVDPLREEPGTMPELFLNCERIRLRAWHMPNTKMKIPKAYTFLNFFSTSKISVKTSCLNNLFAFVVRDCLSELSYKAQLAGLFYVLRPTRNGLELEVRGSSGKQDLFLEKILKVIFDCGNVLTEERFHQVHGLYLNGLHSGDASKLKILAKNILSHVLCPDYHLREARLKIMSGLVVDDLRNHARTFLFEHSLETLFYGNLTITTANKMADSIIVARRDFLQNYVKQFQNGDTEPSENLILEDWFKNDPVNQIGILEKQINELLCDEKSVKSSGAEGEPGSGPESDPDSQQQEKVNVPKNQNEVENEEGGTNEENEEQNDSERNGLEYSLPKNNANTHVVIVNNEIHSSSCVLHYYECSRNHALSASQLELFFHLVQVKLITAMKHVVPLGYVVGCDIRKVNGRLGFRITVESQYPLSIVHKTIEDALEDIDDFLAKMETSEFEMSKAAVMSVKQESMASMRDQAHTVWREIAEQSYHFARHEKELSSMNQLDLLSIRTFYRQWIHSKASERSGVVISIGPDPILNRLEGPSGLSAPGVYHWNLGQIEEFRQNVMSPIPPKIVPKQWFIDVFERGNHTGYFYQPPFLDIDLENCANEDQN